MSESRKLSLTEGHVIAGVKIDAHRFVGRMRAAQLFQVAMDPRRTEDPKQVQNDSQLESVRQIRVEVQRLFEGEKRRNVERYAQYIVAVHEGQNGMAPPMILYAERPLEIEEDQTTGAALIQIPFDQQLVAIDGETQLAARFEAAGIREETKNAFVPVMICHGKPFTWARQVFHDLNLLAVRPNAALGLSMDERDPLTQVARDIADTVPSLRRRVNMVRRQLRSSDTHVLTFTALRGACVTLAEGIGGVKHGARPVPIQKDRIPAINRAALEWFAALTELLGPAMENRTQNLVSASSVMAALGAVGHPLVEIEDDARRQQLCRMLIERLRSVCWEKGKRWEGIAGRFGAKGNFSTSGAKDASYAVYTALNDETSPDYQKIRMNGVVSSDVRESEDIHSFESELAAV